jgi:hypothetical protein
VAADVWKANVNAGFKGSNPFRPAIPDDIAASCSECPTKFTRTVWEDAGKTTIKATLYFVRQKN